MRLIPLALPCLFLLGVNGDGPKVWEKSLAPGVVYRMESRPDIPLLIHAVRISPAATGVRMVPTLAGGTVFEDGPMNGRQTVGKMAADNTAVVGINADFFPVGKTPSGDPLGFMAANGNLLSTPYAKRSVFAWGPEAAEFGPVAFEGSVSAEGIPPIKIDGVNGQCGLNEVELYTSAAGLSVAKKPCVVITINAGSTDLPPSTTLEGTVEAISLDIERTPIPKDRLVLVGHGVEVEALSQLRVGTKLTFALKCTGFDWLRCEHAVGGGPMVLKSGDGIQDFSPEKFSPSLTDQRHPRTAVGKTADGDIWLVVVDGRTATSTGCTLKELAEVMKGLGCTDAMNLDGGGSSAMFIRGVIVNHPSDGSERAVANGILVFSGQPAPTRGPLKIEPTKLGTFQVLDGKQPVENSAVIWGTSGPAQVDQGGTPTRVGIGPAKLTASARGLTASVALPDAAKQRDPNSVRPLVQRDSSRPLVATDTLQPPPRRRLPARRSAVPR